MSIRAETLMTKELISIEESASMKEAYELMRDERIRHVLVRSGSGRICGVISDRDVQRAMSPEIEGEGRSRDIRLDFDPTFQVRDFMSSPARWIAPDASIREVAQTMLQAKISSLLVTGASGKAIGVITTDDLLDYLTSGDERAAEMLAIPIASILRRRAQELSYVS
jgi:CBS domain-containing protein